MACHKCKSKRKKKGSPKKPNVTSHMFAETTHVVAAWHGFACGVIPATQLYILGFIKIRSVVLEPRGGSKFDLPFPSLWLLAFTTACTTVQAVITYISKWWQWTLYECINRTFCNQPVTAVLTHIVIAIIVRATAACPIQTNLLWQTLFQHCSTVCLELSPCIRSELWHGYII